MSHSLRHAVETLTSAAILAVLPAGAAQAATVFSPICQTGTDSVLFLAESTRSCPNAVSACRERIWSYATLKRGDATSHTWNMSPIGSSRLDESASPADNAKSAQQFFEAPKGETAACTAFFRAARLPDPDLADAEGWFRYSFEKGQLMVHWKTNKSVVPFVTRWNVGTCDKNCGAAGPGPIAKEAGKAALSDMEVTTPTFDLRLNDMAILGFPAKGAGNTPSTSMVVSVHLPFLKKNQAFLLYNDALSFSQSARDDLLGGAMITGLLDAALQLDPSNATIRTEYARHLASQGAIKEAMRELKALPATPDLKKTLATDPNFDGLRGNADFQALLKSLP